MELPFSPTFFKKIDIYQRLMTYEKNEPKTSTWKHEKNVLFWIVSRDNTARGSRIDINRIKDILNISIDEAQKVSDGLAMRGYFDYSDDRKSGIFNQAAYLAGEILSETASLTKTKKYKTWIYIWWVAFGSAFFILVNQAVQSFFGLLLKLKWIKQLLPLIFAFLSNKDIVN